MGTTVRLPKIRKILPEVDFESSESPEKSESWNRPICSVELYYPQNNTVDSHSWDEFLISSERNVCHKLVSIWWLRHQACLQTRVCQVYQFEPSTRIWRQFENIHQTIFRPSPTLPCSRCDLQSKVLQLCTIAASCCLPVHNTFLHTFSHVLPCQFSRQVPHTLVFFQLRSRKCVIRTFLKIDWFCLRSVYIHVECIPYFHGQEVMFFRQTRGQQMGDRTNFVQEEPPWLRCLTKILATCVVEDVSMCGHSDCGIFGASTFFYSIVSWYCVVCCSCTSW